MRGYDLAGFRVVCACVQNVVSDLGWELGGWLERRSVTAQDTATHVLGREDRDLTYITTHVSTT